jgi:hypothetical protein
VNIESSRSTTLLLFLAAMLPVPSFPLAVPGAVILSQLARPVPVLGLLWLPRVAATAPFILHPIK